MVRKPNRLAFVLMVLVIAVTILAITDRFLTAQPGESLLHSAHLLLVY